MLQDLNHALILIRRSKLVFQSLFACPIVRVLRSVPKSDRTSRQPELDPLDRRYAFAQNVGNLTCV